MARTAQEIRISGKDSWRVQQLLQDKPRRHVHTDEGGPHEERAAQARIQPAGQYQQAVHLELYPPPVCRWHLHMECFHSLYGRYPDVSVCDAGYGSEENYLYAFRHGIETFIKYNYFHKEQKRSFRNDLFLSANFYYNEETDSMYCPMGQRMERLSDVRRVIDNGFVQTISRYRARNCKGCPLRCRRHRSRWERIVQINHRLRKIKEREREKLLSAAGLKYRSQRSQDVEAVFGNLKNNKHFKRFHLRGLKKVEIAFGPLAIAHNLAKVAS